MVQCDSITSPSSVRPNTQKLHLESLEQAHRKLENHYQGDNNYGYFVNLFHLSDQRRETHSGLNEGHYQRMTSLPPGTIEEMSVVNKVPLPPEIMEHFGHMQCNSMMGLLPEIKRAWLAIDSDIYIWTYEHGSDLAYYDGLGEVIVSVGLVKPKSGVFFPYVKYLLVLTTTVEIVVLGVRFSSSRADGPLGAMECMHLLPEPIFVVPTEGIPISVIAGTDCGRLFLGGRDGSLFEIEYKAERSWLGKRFNKKNHSTGYLSYLVPSFISNLAYGEEDSVMQIEIDNSRNILYSLSEKGKIEVWDLGDKCDGMTRVVSVSLSHIVKCASFIVPSIERKCFMPIVKIFAIELRDSMHLHLLAVTQAGVRFYFSTFLVNQRYHRPSNLHLHHVRIPPGFTANSSANRPDNVHDALHSRGSILLVTSRHPPHPNSTTSPLPVTPPSSSDYDELWCLSHDMFPNMSCLVEAQSVIHVGGRVWALCEEHQPVPLPWGGRGKGDEDLPLVVRQHAVPPAKLIILTAQGVQIIKKLRPVDILRQVLIEGGGPDHEGVKMIFEFLTEIQGCTTALVLACLDYLKNPQISEWATRTFFLYGGDAGTNMITFAPLTKSAENPTNSPLQAGFNPGLSSTPRGSSTPNTITRVLSTPKHTALYLYVSRIIRPLWMRPIVERVISANKDTLLNSSITSDDCAWILAYLHGVKLFLEKNAQFTTNPVASLFEMRKNIGTPNRPDITQFDEKLSLCALKTFIIHACEVISLWKLLCEHQFHIIAQMLDKDLQNQLPETTFKQLIFSGHSLCSIFINALINSYLGDCASVDSISFKLREVCPNLYRNEDAACSKANEMLLAAKKTTHVDEKEEKLRAALNLCKEVVPRIDLAQMCHQFAANQFYVGVLQLCMTCAEKIDPSAVAIQWYDNGQVIEDVDGYEAFNKRMQCYEQVTIMLKQLYRISMSAAEFPTSGVNRAEAQSQAKKILRMALDSTDEVLHVAIYEWMLQERLHSELIESAAPSLEKYLTGARAAASAAAHDANELLWQFYERQGKYDAAAVKLYEIARNKGNRLSLSDRIQYLARAVLFMRSEPAGAAPHLGVFLQELEDKVDVAQVQEKVLNAVRHLDATALKSKVEIEARLNQELLTCSELYEQYADPLNLWECKLAIVHVTNHCDPTLLEDVWRNIIADETRKHMSWEEKVVGVMNKIQVLVAEYGSRARIFPLLFVVRSLEILRCKGSCRETIYVGLLAAGVPYLELLLAYQTLLQQNERVWTQEGDDFHLMKTIAQLTAHFTENPTIVPPQNRRAAVTKSQDLISSCVVSLYTKTNTQELITTLKSVESRLKRMGGF